MRLPALGMRFSRALTGIALSTLVLIVACNSSSSTPTPGVDGPTATPGRIVVRTQSPDDVTPVSVTPTPTYTPIGTRNLVGRGGSGLSDSSFTAVGLPSHCRSLSEDSETFIRNSINTDSVSHIGILTEDGKDSDGIQFIATQLTGIPDSLSGSEAPIAIWGTFSKGAALLTYENTWPANQLAAEYSNFPGAGGSSGIYEQMPGFAAAAECAEAAANSVTISVGPTIEAGDAPEYTFNRSRCVFPDLPTSQRIANSLQTDLFESLELKGEILLQPEDFGGGAVTWHYGAEVEGIPSEISGTYAIWLKIVERDGTTTYYSRNDLANSVSDLPYPPFDEVAPSSAADIAHLEDCIRGETKAPETPSSTPFPLFVSEINVSDCVRPSSDTVAQLSRFLEPESFLTDIGVITIETWINGEGVGDQLVFIAADISGSNPNVSDPIAIWQFFNLLDTFYFIYSLTESAGKVSVIPTVDASDISSDLRDYMALARECALSENNPNADMVIVPSGLGLNPESCLMPDEAVASIIRDSLTDPEIQLTNMRMVESQFIAGTPSGLFFVAADVRIPGEESAFVAIWVWDAIDPDNPATDDVYSASYATDEITTLAPSDGAESFAAAINGFQEAKACVALAPDETQTPLPTEPAETEPDPA